MTTGTCIIYNYAGSTVLKQHNVTVQCTCMHSQSLRKSIKQTQQIWMSLVAQTHKPHSLSDQPSAALDLGNFSQPFLMSQPHTYDQCYLTDGYKRMYVCFQGMKVSSFFQELVDRREIQAEQRCNWSNESMKTVADDIRVVASVSYVNAYKRLHIIYTTNIMSWYIIMQL